MKKTILLVEDSKLQKIAMEKALLRAGYLVLFAGDGEEGLRLARESMPDLVLLDLRLPGIDGEEVLHVLKQDPHTRRIPVIVVSDVAPPAAAKLKAAGAADYFEKSRFLAADDGERVFLAAIDRVIAQTEVANPASNSIPLLARRQGV